MAGAGDHSGDFIGREIHVANDFVRRSLAVAGRTDGGGAAACRIAAGVDAGERGLLRALAYVDGVPLGCFECGFRLADDRVRRVTERHDHQIDLHRFDFAGWHRAAAA